MSELKLRPPNEDLSVGYLPSLNSSRCTGLRVVAGFGFGGADFAEGGGAGAMAGAPHVPGGDGAEGAPAFAKGEESFGLGPVFFAVGDGPALLHPEVVDGEHIGAAEAEH